MSQVEQIEADILRQVIIQRPSDSYKSNYGRLLLIGGSENYGGAIIMATEGAVNAGAGLVAVATHSMNLTALHARLPEAMFIDWQDKNLANLISKMDVIVCGPGLGNGRIAQKIMQIVQENVTSKQTLLLDASALDLISIDKTLVPKRAGHIILTPHQMEWQRLSQIRIPFQTDEANKSALNQLFPEKNATLVLKSNNTHIYAESGQVFVNPLGNPGMATGGMGDTLAGILGAFVGQFGFDTKTVLAGVYLHSLAGDTIYQDNYVVKPTRVSSLLPKLMKKYSKDD